jgi:hypothetical protein
MAKAISASSITSTAFLVSSTGMPHLATFFSLNNIINYKNKEYVIKFG